MWTANPIPACTGPSYRRPTTRILRRMRSSAAPVSLLTSPLCCAHSLLFSPAPASPAPATSAIPPSCCPPPSPLPLLPTDPAMSTCEQTFAETHAHACARCWTRFVAVFLRPAAVCRLSQRRRAGGRGGVRRDAVPPALPRVRPVIVPAIVPALPPATAAGNHLYPRSFAEALAKKGGGRRGDQVRD